jgi:hypothetical protein
MVDSWLHSLGDGLPSWMMASIKTGIDFGKATITQQEGVPS